MDRWAGGNRGYLNMAFTKGECPALGWRGVGRVSGLSRGQNVLDDAMDAVGVLTGGMQEFELAGREPAGGIIEEEVDGHLQGSHGGADFVGQ